LTKFSKIVVFLAVLGFLWSCSAEKKSEEQLYAQAQSFSEKGNFTSAIKTYEEILRLYPESPNSYKAQFLIGFVYSENLKDYNKAKEVYEKVIEKYPHCNLADDAKYMIESMGSDSLPKNLPK
jgi:outer membrane protein assembly factor BamD (BamD/ComL family)